MCVGAITIFAIATVICSVTEYVGSAQQRHWLLLLLVAGSRSTFIRNKYGVECGLCAIGLIVLFDLFAVCFVNVCIGIIFQACSRTYRFDTNEFAELKSDKQARNTQKPKKNTQHQRNAARHTVAKRTSKSLIQRRKKNSIDNNTERQRLCVFE